tara:strand:- start:212 stop:427 length:216 start_codon:yes stop_codon:yes gene_type:complete
MVFELFSTILIDGAGAKAKKASDEKKLKEAEGDPEKIEQILADVEKRKQNARKFFLCLIGIFILAEIFYWS